MKTLALALGAATGALCIAGSAWAQFGPTDEKPDRRFYLSPMATYSLYDGDRDFEDGLGYHLGIGKILSRGANLELHASFAEPDADGASADGELISYGATVLLFQNRAEFPMYGILSIAKNESSASGGDVEASADQFDVGLGYLIGLGNWPGIGRGAALRVEARYRLDKFSRGEANVYAGEFGTGGDRNYHDGVFGVGLLIPLGTDPNRSVEIEEPKVTSRIVISPPDQDGDQIPDDMDECPNTPSGAVIDARGCELDSDRDGVPDSRDACPGTPVNVEVGEDGCRLDADKDGVPDATDQCPNTPAGLPVMSDGCALRGDCRLPKPGDRIDAQGCAATAIVLKGVNFELNSAKLTPEARQVLDRVADTLRASSDLRVEVGGHTDAIGEAGYNQRLSDQRASSVARYLRERGVAAGVLVARGYGESRPIADNDTAEGREANRRVELKLLND